MSEIDTPEEKEIIREAKEKLMREFKLSEMEAYRIIRDTSMRHKIRKAELAIGLLNNAK